MTFPCQGMMSVLLAFVSCPSAAMHGPLTSVVKSYDRPIQDVRPSTITKLYRDLLTSGGRDGQPLAVAIVTHLHAGTQKGVPRCRHRGRVHRQQPGRTGQVATSAGTRA